MILVKCNYFGNLEELSSLSAEAVALVCSGDGKQDVSELRRNCDRLVCETEDALFSDFLPPLERDNIAAMAHTLSRIVDKAYELLSDPSFNPAFMKANDEAKICVSLSKELSSGISMLRRIRRPEETPDVQGFRTLLADGRAAHKKMILDVRSGRLPKNAAETVILTGRLRSELSRAFDELVEIMLNNI